MSHRPFCGAQGVVLSATDGEVHRLRVLGANLDEHEVTRLSLHQRDDLAIVRPEHQISFPVTWHGAILN